MTTNSFPSTPELLLAHREWVRALARTLARDHATANDLEQQTWLSAVERPPRTGDNPRAWLARVVRNWALRDARSRERRHRREAASARPESYDAGDLAARAEAQQTVAREVLALSEPFRSTVLLRFFEDLPMQEVARRTGVPHETARSRLRIAKARLRAALAPIGGGSSAVAPPILLLAGADSARALTLPNLVGVTAMAAGKKLLVVAVVLPLMVGSALVGTTLVESEDKGGISAAEAAALTDRIEQLERAAEKKDQGVRRRDRRIAELSEQVVSMEMEKARADLAAASASAATGTATAEGDARDDAPKKTPKEELEEEATDLMINALGQRVGSLQHKMKMVRLRLLPEEERWAKAVEVVGLTGGQVAALKQIYGDRDRAYADATVERTVEGDEGEETHIEVNQLALDEADRAHEHAVTGTLDSGQLGKWRKAAFPNAFGRTRPKNEIRTATR